VCKEEEERAWIMYFMVLENNKDNFVFAKHCVGAERKT